MINLSRLLLRISKEMVGAWNFGAGPVNYSYGGNMDNAGGFPNSYTTHSVGYGGGAVPAAVNNTRGALGHGLAYLINTLITGISTADLPTGTVIDGASYAGNGTTMLPFEGNQSAADDERPGSEGVFRLDIVR